MKSLGILWIDLNIALLRIKLSQHVGFSGSGVGMPLRRGSASGQKKEGILFVRLLWRFARFLEEKLRSAINSKETAILEQPPLRRNLTSGVGRLAPQNVRFAKRPLDPAAFVEHPIITDACDVWASSRETSLRI